MTRHAHNLGVAVRRAFRPAMTAVCAVMLLLLDVAVAGAITRQTVLARAQRWVDLKVPYSQSSYFEGYRQDCSGFVSMSWALTNAFGAPLSLASDTLPSRGVPISKDRLLPGDMIVRPKTATTWGHAVIFGGWADPGRTSYWCLEESNSAGGTRLRLTPYPYWPSSGPGFAPYRFVGITEDLARTTRVAGGDRYATATAASQRAFPDPSPVRTVILATGASWPDALGGSGLAGAVRGPVLLTARNGLPTQVRSELSRLAPERVLIVGGEAAVSEVVADQVRLLGIEVIRVAGDDRYVTAAQVARRVVQETATSGGSFDGTVYVATGEQFPDALAVSSVAAFRRRPVLLSRRDSLPEATAAALVELGARRAIVVGGEGAVSPAVRDSLADLGIAVTRISGADRYATAQAVAGHAVAEGLGRSNAGLATGAHFADALAAGPALGLSARPSVLLLTPPSGLPAGVYSLLGAHEAEIGTLQVYGGTAALSEQVRAEAAAALKGW